MRKLCLILLFAVAGSLGGCGYNALMRDDEAVKASWSEVLNQYQRRADLVPNLVRTVQGEAAFEQATLTRVVEARARATGIQASPALIDDPAAFRRFEQAQGELGGALSRLLAVSEAYPSLRSNQGFRDLQSQLEGTENRIAVARRRYIESVQAYNVEVRTLPSNLTAMAIGMKTHPVFSTNDDVAVARPPAVDFTASGALR
jgi:LemA protein